jgi:hypothetical protein
MQKDRFVRSVLTAGKFVKAVKSALAVARMAADVKELIDPDANPVRADAYDQLDRAVRALEKDVVDWLNAVTRDR